MSHFIPSIFNYCDRWCERCTFIDRCSMGVMEQKRWAKGEDWDEDDFFEHLEKIHPMEEGKIEEWLEEFEMDLNEIDPDYELPSADDKAESLEKEMREFGSDYYKPLKQFLHDNQDALKTRGIDLFSEKPHQTGRDIHERSALAEALEVILWYQHFMFVKASRAISGLADMHNTALWENAHQSDANGSAKVALIAAERSLGAWDLLRHLWPEKQTEALLFIRKINTFRHRLAQIFPNWKNFIRPGFDTEKPINYLRFGDN